jgi:hypothetical protein
VRRDAPRRPVWTFQKLSGDQPQNATSQPPHSDTNEYTWGRPSTLERAKGFEPSTPTLARLCSTPELHPHPRRQWPLPAALLCQMGERKANRFSKLRRRSLGAVSPAVRFPKLPSGNKKIMPCGGQRPAPCGCVRIFFLLSFSDAPERCNVGCNTIFAMRFRGGCHPGLPTPRRRRRRRSRTPSAQPYMIASCTCVDPRHGAHLNAQWPNEGSLHLRRAPARRACLPQGRVRSDAAASAVSPLSVTRPDPEKASRISSASSPIIEPRNTSRAGPRLDPPGLVKPDRHSPVPAADLLGLSGHLGSRS